MISIMENKTQTTLLQAYDEDLRRMKLRVGRDRAASTYQKLEQGRKYVADFMASQLSRADIPLCELSLSFIDDFATWLQTVRQLRDGTVWLACQLLKGVVTRAYHRGLLPRNPFCQFHIPKNIRPREFLTEDELISLISRNFKKRHLALARDIFVFSSLTGLSFIDIKELQPAALFNINGERWIIARRHKTQVQFLVRLLPKPLEIIARYGQTGDRPIFGNLQYRTLAKNIKQVMKECGFSRNITMHCARHTFAVLALNKGMPIESVSRVLGHTNITTTQLYARITMLKLSADFKHLEQATPLLQTLT